MPKELILTQDVEGLGITGDVVKVAEGYARNFLLPKKLATPVTAMAQRQLERIIAERQARMIVEREEAKGVAEKLAELSLTIPVKAGPGGKLYGSVTTGDISDALAKQGYSFNRHKIHSEKPLRELGVFDVTIKLHPEVECPVKVWVVEE